MLCFVCFALKVQCFEINLCGSNGSHTFLVCATSVAHTFYFDRRTKTMETIKVWYANIGKKIKDWAIWIFVVEAIAAVIAGIIGFFVFCSWRGDDGGYIWAFLCLIAIPIAIFVEFVSTWLLYGFGELIDKVCIMESRAEKALTEKEKNEYVYQSACELMQKNDFKSAISLFASIGEYKDAKEKIQMCESNLQKEHKRAKKIIIYFCATFLFLIAFITVCNSLEKYSNYSHAVNLMETERYESAITEFEALGDYRDSYEKIIECHKGIKYNDAMYLKNQGKYERAIDIFKSLGEYKDSKAQISDCEMLKSWYDVNNYD